MSYSNCGYPNMSIKKFEEKYPHIRIKKLRFENVYYLTLYSLITVEIATLNLDTRMYYFNNSKYHEEFIDDIRLLYKYLLKEYKKREELKRKREEDGKDN